MQVTNDKMVAAHLHVSQELKHAIGRNHVKEEAWVLRNVSVQDEFDVIGLHTRSLRKLLIENILGAGEGQGLADLRIGGMPTRIEPPWLQSTLMGRGWGRRAVPYNVIT